MPCAQLRTFQPPPCHCSDAWRCIMVTADIALHCIALHCIALHCIADIAVQTGALHAQGQHMPAPLSFVVVLLTARLLS